MGGTQPAMPQPATPSVVSVQPALLKLLQPTGELGADSGLWKMCGNEGWQEPEGSPHPPLLTSACQMAFKSLLLSFGCATSCSLRTWDRGLRDADAATLAGVPACVPDLFSYCHLHDNLHLGCESVMRLDNGMEGMGWDDPSQRSVSSQGPMPTKPKSMKSWDGVPQCNGSLCIQKILLNE